jgi:hypothetical protein
MNKTFHEHRSETLFSVDQLGMELNTTFHDRWLANRLLASTALDADHWILFDSGASANDCPKNFGEEWPLLPLNGEPPPLRSIRWTAFTCVWPSFDSYDFVWCSCMFSLLCVYRVISVATLQGYKVNMDPPDTCIL